MATILYNPRPIVGQSFKGQKILTVPGQSLSLREIIKRFVRRESVPVSHEGVYEHRFGDLEKIAKMDMFDQMEKVGELREQIAAFNAREKERIEKEKADAVAKREAEIIEAAKNMAKSASPARGPAEGLDGSSRT